MLSPCSLRLVELNYDLLFKPWRLVKATLNLSHLYVILLKTLKILRVRPLGAIAVAPRLNIFVFIVATKEALLILGLVDEGSAYVMGVLTCLALQVA